MGSLFDIPKPEPPPAPVVPPEPPKSDITDSEALQNARRRALSESSRRGRNALKIPLAGTSGGSGIAVAK